MSDAPPDRLSSNPKSPFYNAALLERGVGIRFRGVEKTNVEEDRVTEGWVRVVVGKTLDRNGAPLTMKLTGPVEPYFRDVGFRRAELIAGHCPRATAQRLTLQDTAILRASPRL